MAAADKSAKLGIDEGRLMIRPLLKSKRNIIILRDIPDGTTEDEIRGIFDDAPHKDKLVSVKPEVNNTWFVKFDLDEGTKDVVSWLRSQKFKGNTCSAAIKSEHFLRSFFPLNLAGGVQMGQKGGMPGAMPGPMPGMDGGYMMGPPGPPAQAGKGSRKGKGNDMNGWGQQGSWGGGKGEGSWGGGKGAGKGAGKGKGGWGIQPPGYWQPWGVKKSGAMMGGADMPVVVNQAANLSPDIFDNTGSMGIGKSEGKGKKAGKKGEGGDSKWKPKKDAGDGAGGAGAPTSPTGAGVGQRPSGYDGDFKKYSREEIEKIFSTIGSPPIPEAIEGHREDFPIFLDEASIVLAAATPSGGSA
eukprot:gnl/MRDRNA2_/MRDRNA2_30988_c0_seq1.p1 gnl/MRDRNA2_/MRDRNA2_30988_c0~~gnl/MRDRNA2_/MRDRNA2_30988_c0_seq1.p1  ORF type:complete len:416 (-),score=94.33 gnl/MRDRNA2_/MRDRNA2_30988_c0_seq1:17-1081(-)